MKRFSRIAFLTPVVGLACLITTAASCNVALGAAKRPVNLLFLITDQQRWDALGCAGNNVLTTPNLDRLAREGARFAKFYSSCPVCSPARTTILTGRSIGTHKVSDNRDITRSDLPDFVTFDQILLRGGYRGEYHGKYHSPYKLALNYTYPVRWVSLRPLIEGTDDGTGHIAISEWNATHFPGFMIFDGRWKLMFGQSASAPSLDAIYDLQTDPHEGVNLIGRNPDREKYRGEAKRLKGLLIAWLERVKSPYLAGVKARPVIAPVEPVQKKASAPRKSP
jgi:arylsulfatase A-like enzyme